MRILRLNNAGQPLEWIDWQQAACLHTRGLISWSLGDVIFELRGGKNRLTGNTTLLELPSIIASGGSQLGRQRQNPYLTNRALFERDNYQCLYCGKLGTRFDLTRDHVIPKSKGGKDCWENVVTACRRCNQFKGSRLLEDLNMELLALPYRPNPAEYLALMNSRRILPDQIDYLSKQFSSNCRWLEKSARSNYPLGENDSPKIELVI